MDNIEFKKVGSDLFESNCEAWVNTVNCVGVMGKGIALGFKQRFSMYFKNYQEICRKGLLQPGRAYEWEQRYCSDFSGPNYIISFSTKDHWRNPSKIKWIKSGLQDLRDIICDHRIGSVAIPALGCSNGGLDWQDVKPLILSFCSSLPSTRFEIYEPR